MKKFIFSMIAGLALCACTPTTVTNEEENNDTVEVVDSVSPDSTMTEVDTVNE